MDRFIVLLISLLLSLSVASSSYAVDIPSLTGPIVDKEHLLIPKVFDELEVSLKDFYKQTGVQLQILTVPSFQGLTIEEYSLAVVDQWKLGKGGDDRGVLLLISKRERRARIEVGTGLEGKLPDILAGRIVDGMISYFRRGEFQHGVVYAISTVGEVLGTPILLKDYNRQRRNTQRQIGSGTILFVLLLVSVFGRMFIPLPLLVMAGSSRRYGSWGGYRSSGGSGGGFGGGGWSGGGGGFSGGGASGSW